MIRLLKRFLVSALVLGSLGCGGEVAVRSPAHVRVFNAFSDQTNIRGYFGTRLYSGGGVGPSVDYGNELAYGDAPSGTVDIAVNPYIDLTNSWATLTGQTLVKGGSYTLVGMTLGTTRRITLYEDGLVQDPSSAYVRIIDAAATPATIYYTLRKASDNTIALQTTTAGQAAGGSSGYQAIQVTSTDSVPYILNVYSSSAFNNSISGNIAVTLTPGRPVTVFLYLDKSGQIVAKSAVDVFVQQ